MNTASIEDMTGEGVFDLSAMEKFCYKVMERLEIDGWELSVVLCGDEFMRTLNHDYRGKDEPTDVLSFPQEEPEHDGVTYAGDIAISIDSVRSNAENFGVAPEEETRRVLIHGILHLAGMDHETNGQTEPMLVLQEEILQSVTGEALL